MSNLIVNFADVYDSSFDMLKGVNSTPFFVVNAFFSILVCPGRIVAHPKQQSLFSLISRSYPAFYFGSLCLLLECVEDPNLPQLLVIVILMFVSQIINGVLMEKHYISHWCEFGHTSNDDMQLLIVCLPMKVATIRNLESFGPNLFPVHKNTNSWEQLEDWKVNWPNCNGQINYAVACLMLLRSFSSFESCLRDCLIRFILDIWE